MTKLPVISGKEAVKALAQAGFTIVRQRGSHIRMKKVTSVCRAVVRVVAEERRG